MQRNESPRAGAQNAELHGLTDQGTSNGAMLWRQFSRNRGALAGGAVLLILLIVAVLAPWLAPYDPIQDMDTPFLKPGAPGHILGTDDYGRDIFSRLVFGARISLQVGLIVVGMSALVGVTLGALAGYYGGWIDMIIMRLVDILFSFPFFILAISIMAILGPSITNAMIALGMISWISYARLVRGQVLSVRETEYVEASRALGLSDVRIIFKHVLPNCLAPVIIQATLGVGGAILAAAGLSFIGLGAQPPQPEWGAMLNEGRPFLRIASHLTMIPGLAIAITVLSLNLLGDGLRDALDPRLKN